MYVCVHVLVHVHVHVHVHVSLHASYRLFELVLGNVVHSEAETECLRVLLPKVRLLYENVQHRRAGVQSRKRLLPRGLDVGVDQLDLARTQHVREEALRTRHAGRWLADSRARTTHYGQASDCPPPPPPPPASAATPPPYPPPATRHLLTFHLLARPSPLRSSAPRLARRCAAPCRAPAARRCTRPAKHAAPSTTGRAHSSSTQRRCSRHVYMARAAAGM